MPISKVILDDTDRLLVPFLEALDEVAGERLLAELLDHQARPIIRKVLLANLARSSSSSGIQNQRSDLQDLDDLIAEVNIRLLERLRRLKAARPASGINHFLNYVAGLSHNVCHTYLRSKYPERTRLKNKIRYILGQSKTLALWEAEDGHWICGLLAWKDARRPTASDGWVNDAQRDARRLPEPSDRQDTFSALCWIFRRTQSPIDLEHVVTLTATVLGIHEVSVVSHSDLGNHQQIEFLPNQSPDQVEGIDHHKDLKRLWTEIAHLQPQQKAALLLGLRNNLGQNVTVLSDLRIATISQIAEQVGMDPVEFAAFSDQLPLPDSRIAQYLGVQPRQVISYRLAARRRLVRRMKMPGESQ
jgi:hypothetical protein